MTQRAFNRVAGGIFLAIAFMHVLRLVFRWEAVIGGWHVPFWLSGAGVLIAGFLACIAFTRKP